MIMCGNLKIRIVGGLDIDMGHHLPFFFKWSRWQLWNGLTWENRRFHGLLAVNSLFGSFQVLWPLATTICGSLYVKEVVCATKTVPSGAKTHIMTSYRQTPLNGIIDTITDDMNRASIMYILFKWRYLKYIFRSRI